MIMPGVSLKAKIVGFAVLALLTFAFVGAVLEQVKDIQEATDAQSQPLLLRDQFAAASGDLSRETNGDGAAMASLKYV